MVKCSIIIPHYNSTTSLVKLLDTIPNIEEIQVLVIDDQSDLEYRERLLTIQEKGIYNNVEFYINERCKKGAGVCRNIGLKFAKGEWILFADADDYYVENFYNNIKHFFNTDKDVIFFKPTSEEIDTGNLSNRHLPYAELINNQIIYNNSLSEKKLRYFFLVPWSKLIRKKVIDNNKIVFDEVIAANDVMFSVILGHYMERFEVSHKVIYCVTRSKGSLTTTLNEEIFNSRTEVFIRYYKFLKKNLTKKDFKLIKAKLSGRGILLKSLNFGPAKTMSVFKMIRRNGIHIVDSEFFNPVTFTKKILHYIKVNQYKKDGNI